MEIPLIQSTNAYGLKEDYRVKASVLFCRDFEKPVFEELRERTS